MPSLGKIVVLRFSAMGDVAMVASVLHEFAIQNPKVQIVMVSREAFKAFFDEIPNLTFHALLPKTTHKGIGGLYTLFKELQRYQPNAIADLHDNLRSRLLSTFFRFTGIRIKRIDKGRAEKKALTRSRHKVLKPLKLTVERYADVFKSIGFKLQLTHKLKNRDKELPIAAAAFFKSDSVKIGISPFAQHSYKVYPMAKMESVVAALDALNYAVFIFGGGNAEKEIAISWENKFSHVINLIGKFNLAEELAIIGHLDLMVSMDSSGMHMASLMGVPVLSIWGPTHPYAGFLGYGQKMEDCIQIDHPQRPNSIYGNKPCYCGDEPCIDKIEPSIIVNKIKEKLTHG